MAEQSKPPVREEDTKIDALLESYLSLLDEYTTLRSDLSQLQTQTFQHLARANFSAERGVRYGADFFDERMQASRRVVVDASPATPATFRVVPRRACQDADDKSRSRSEHHGSRQVAAEEEAGAGQTAPRHRSTSSEAAPPSPAAHDGEAAETTTTTAANPAHPVDGEEEEEPPTTATTAMPGVDETKGEPRQQPEPVNSDPLRWFGILTPMALRQTQATAIQVVEDVVPRLISIDAAMRNVEIEVRRVRKRRAKAKAAAEKANKARQKEEQVTTAGTDERAVSEVVAAS